jgi:hypothetical protein
MSKTIIFKILLVVQTVALLLYTFFAFEAEGANLFGVFIANIQSLTWSGQFNLDFLCYLTLSGLWIMWREKFNEKSIVTGIAAMILGIVFFAPYILWQLNKEKGDLKRLLIGDR